MANKEKERGVDKNLVIGLVALVALFFVYKAVHFWNGPTCTEPATCSLCGEVGADALGHNWSKPSSCTEKAVCTTCGAEGAAGQHNWQPATYSQPEICSICGAQQGHALGYIPTVSGEWSDEKFWRTGRYMYPYEFDEALENCSGFTLTYEIVSVDHGDVYGNFELYVRTINGTWKNIDIFEMEQRVKTVVVRFDPYTSIDAIAVVCLAENEYSYTEDITITDAYVHPN